MNGEQNTNQQASECSALSAWLLSLSWS